MMNRRAIILTLGLLIAFWLAVFGDKHPDADVAEPVARSKGARAGATNTASSASAISSTGGTGNTRASARAVAAPVAILALQDRDDLFGQPTPEPKGKKDAKTDALASEALFGSHSWDPPPPPPPKPLPPPPPVAPPVPFIFIGKKLEDSRWEVYLSRGEQTFIAHEQDTIDNQYRVDSIKPPVMTLTYIPLNQTQTLTIGGTD